MNKQIIITVVFRVSISIIYHLIQGLQRLQNLFALEITKVQNRNRERSPQGAWGGKKNPLQSPSQSYTLATRQVFSTGGRWRVAGDGWRVTGDGWRKCYAWHTEMFLGPIYGGFKPLEKASHCT